MRWLLILFLASLVALLFAVAGVVRYVRLQQRLQSAVKPMIGDVQRPRLRSLLQGRERRSERREKDER